MARGKKRSNVRNGNDRNVDETKSFGHSDSLVDEVRASRDPEFAAENRIAKKRRIPPKNNARHDRRRLQNEDAEANDKESRRIDAVDDSVVDAKLSAKILEEARKQRDEVRDEDLGLGDLDEKRRSQAQLTARTLAGDESSQKFNIGVEDSDESEDDSELEDHRATSFGDRALDVVGVEMVDGSLLTAADELALAMFSGEEPGPGTAEAHDEYGEGESGQGRLLLADIILAKIREKEERIEAEQAAADDPVAAARNEKIAEVYSMVGGIMARYKSGRVPKAFKVIPKLPNWEDLMYLTRPDEWTPAAMYAATRLFASNLSSKDVVPFYRDILLPRCLQDISENKKLNYHLYRSLKKAMYKPDAFNKGILFTLCQSDGCSLREATIVGSVLSHVSMPMLHSAAALLYIAEQAYALSHSVFIHLLLNKKYSLPYRVIDALVTHFTRLKNVSRSLPLVWHISLLTFARCYKTELESSQKDELKLLMRVQTHPKITPEIRRELFSSRCRGEVVDPDANTIAKAIASV